MSDTFLSQQNNSYESVKSEKLTAELNEGASKAADIQSSASTLDSLTKQSIQHLQQLFRKSANREATDVTYIISGDSTRDNTYNEMLDYYEFQLFKILANIYRNAASGQSSQDWKNNTDQATVQQAIDNSTGVDGENTILEYSFGINDYKNGATKADVKGWIQEGIDIYLTAKPKATIILAVPVKTGNTERNTVLQEIYSELSVENNLFLIDTYSATDAVQGNSDYYQDATHPNKFGSRRIVNYILDQILPLELLSMVTIEPYDRGDTLPPVISPIVESGYWRTDDGTPIVSENWRRLQNIPVEPNFVIEVTHQGNRADLIYMNDSDEFIEIQRPIKVGNTLTSTIPGNGWNLRVNISSDGANYDLIGDVVTVAYQDPSSGLYLTIEDINSGLDIRNVLSRFRDGILVDNYGSIGAAGQTLNVDTNNKMKWE